MCVCVRSLVSPLVRPSAAFLDRFLKHENGDTKAETIRKVSEKGSKILKFEHIRDDLKLT